jgi:hypothetical protein
MDQTRKKRNGRGSDSDRFRNERTGNGLLPDSENKRNPKAAPLCRRRLRAIVELKGDELTIYPIGDSDAECDEIVAALLLDGGRETRQ